MTRQFTSAPAVRANVPLLIALIGPSGGGKTYSALRLASGIKRVQPGPIYGISTEGNRMLEYAEKFDFTHVPFAEPFGSLDYLDALRQCEAESAKTIIVDSMSHEHEGPGGVLDQADQYILNSLRRKNIDPESDAGWHAAQKLKRSAWIEPKAKRTKLIQGIVQLRTNVILCFRAKEVTDQINEGGKTKIIKLGWLPVAGTAFWFEMTARAMLLPGANGVPEWKHSNLEKGERIAVRRPDQFADILRDGEQLSEDMGEAMARWASGSVTIGFDAALERVKAARDASALRSVASTLRSQEWNPENRAAIAQAITARQAELKAAAT